MKTLLRHSNGTVKVGYVRSIAGGWMRVTWTETGSEGVDISEATGKSPLGAWMDLETA